MEGGGRTPSAPRQPLPPLITLLIPAAESSQADKSRMDSGRRSGLKGVPSTLIGILLRSHCGFPRQPTANPPPFSPPRPLSRPVCRHFAPQLAVFVILKKLSRVIRED